jgi:hypothetical protein
MNFITLNERLERHADNSVYEKWEGFGLLEGLAETEYQTKAELAQIYEDAVNFATAETAEHPVHQDLAGVYPAIIRRLYSTKNCHDYRRIWTSLLAYIKSHEGTMREIAIAGGDAEMWVCHEFCNDYEEYGKLFSGKIEKLKL